MGIAILKCSAATLKALIYIKVLFYYTSGEVATIPEELYKSHVKKPNFLLSIKKVTK